MKLKFTKKALYRLEKEKDVKMGDLQSMGDPSQFKLSLLVDLIWAGRLHENPNITVDQILEEFEFEELQEYGESIAEAIEEAFGGIEPAKEPVGNGKETDG